MIRALREGLPELSTIVRRVLLAAAGGLVLLVLLTLPALIGLGNTWQAQRSAEHAWDALSRGDLPAAREHLADAEGDNADAHATTEGWRGTWWSVLPGGDEDAADLRSLTSAQEELLSATGTVLDSLPVDGGGRAPFTAEGGGLDVPAVSRVAGQTDQLSRNLLGAIEHAEAVQGDTPLLGRLFRDSRSELLTRIRPISQVVDAVRPLAAVVPELLGDHGERDVVVALLNPAEQRFSGGATLMFLPARIDDGNVRLGDPVSGGGGEGAFRSRTWKPVPGNPFHRPGQRLRLSTAALAPSWPVSGEELLRAWEKVEGVRPTTLIVVDVMALERLFRFTGPIKVAGFDKLTSANLADQLVGSYDEYQSERDFRLKAQGRSTLLRVFMHRLVSPARWADKINSALASAKGRHVAVYSRHAAVQRAFEQMGLTGNLSPTRRDYIGVFNQALVGQKTDFWQRRSVNSEVQVFRRGNAKVRMTIMITNDAPQAPAGIDPQYRNYVRSTNYMSLGVFLPSGARAVRVRTGHHRRGVAITDYFGRPFFRLQQRIGPGATRTIHVNYRVRGAAIEKGKTLAYGLDVDPHPLVQPERLGVTVHWPPGYRTAGRVPPGWVDRGSSVIFQSQPLNVSPRWQIQARQVAPTE